MSIPIGLERYLANQPVIECLGDIAVVEVFGSVVVRSANKHRFAERKATMGARGR
jgi:hypothetical protein